jgi:hypothetical protein
VTRIQVRELAVLAYGSLLAHPRDYLGSRMVKLMRCNTPFPVEYAGRSEKRRGGGPTLVRWQAGRPVVGGLIVLDKVDQQRDLDEVREALALREGAKDGKSKCVRDDLEMFGYRVVYSDFRPAIAEGELSAQVLGQYAVSSVAECAQLGYPFCNGIRYLAENIEWGIDTALTCDYRKQILEMTGCTGLHKAEAKLFRVAMKNQEGQSLTRAGSFFDRDSHSGEIK